jgi:hypothetical protein
MQEWYERKDQKDLPLEGEDSDIFAKPGANKDGPDVSPYAKDLISVNERSTDIDAVTAWVAEKIVSCQSCASSTIHKSAGIEQH